MSIQEYDSLVLDHAGGLKPFAFTLTRDREKASDLCQETLYKAFAYRHHYQPGTNIRAWLYTIMRNIFINDYRRQARRKLLMDQIRYSQTAFVFSAERNVMTAEINRAIYQLPFNFKTACQLYLHGYKYQEIALALNEPLGTIKSRIHFAKKILQKKIGR